MTHGGVTECPRLIYPFSVIPLLEYLGYLEYFSAVGFYWSFFFFMADDTESAWIAPYLSDERNKWDNHSPKLYSLHRPTDSRIRVDPLLSLYDCLRFHRAVHFPSSLPSSGNMLKQMWSSGSVGNMEVKLGKYGKRKLHQSCYQSRRGVECWSEGTHFQKVMHTKSKLLENFGSCILSLILLLYLEYRNLCFIFPPSFESSDWSLFCIFCFNLRFTLFTF